MRREMEERLDMHAVDIYGLSEVMGPGVAQECVETKDGLHVWEDHFYPEVVDPVTGEVLPDGEEGELVFTSLTKQAMPVIRYRTRDLTRLLPGTARTMRRMEKITGRTDDMIILRGVNLFPTQIEELILRTPALSPHFQCVLTAPGRLDEMTVRVERRAERPADGRRPRPAPSCAQLVKNTIGVTRRGRGRRPGRHRALGRQDAPDRRRATRSLSLQVGQRVRRREAPHRPTPMPTTAPPSPTSCCERDIWSCTERPPSRSEASAPPEARNQRRVSRPRSAACTSSPPMRASR